MNSYAPGLMVVSRRRHRCRRVLPIPGQVLVQVRQQVEPSTLIALAELPGQVVPVNLAHALAISASDVPRVMASRPRGTVVRAGETLAESRGMFGWFPRQCPSPIDGVVEVISRITGQVMLRGPARPVQVSAYLAGTIVEVLPGEGAIVEADTTFIQGIFGIGGEAHGPIQCRCTAPDQPLTAEQFTPECRGSIVVGGSRVTAEGLRAGVAAGVSAIVTGGIDDQDLRGFLGYDLGVATTGAERVGLTLIITEGFGDIAMADRTWQLLRSRAGAPAACNGATQIRAGVLRPEILIPWQTAPAAGDEAVPRAAGRPLAVGAAIRIIRDPYFGQIGSVAALPSEPAVLASGSRARVLDVRTTAGDLLRVPRANVELIED